MRRLILNPLVRSIVQSGGLANDGPLWTPRRAGAWRRRLSLLACGTWLLQASAFGAMPDVSFSAASVDFGDLRFEEVSADLSAASHFEFKFDRMTGPGEAYLRDGLVVSGSLGPVTMEDGGLALSSTLEARGLRASINVRDEAGEWVVKLKALGQPLTVLAGWPGLPSSSSWLSGGQFDSDIVFRQGTRAPAALAWRFDIDGLGFDSPEGRYAGEGLQLELRGAWKDIGAEAATLQGAVLGGELLIDDFYRDFTSAGLTARADVHWSEEELAFTHISVGDGDAMSIEAAARVNLGEDEVGKGAGSLEIGRLDLDFPAAYRRYVEPMAAAWTLDGLEVTGHVTWSGEWALGALVSGDLNISDFSIVDTRRRRFAVTGLEAHLRPGDYTFESRLTWRGLLFGRINLGAGEALLDSEPGTIALLEPLVLDVLSGTVEVNTLKVVLPGGRADGTGEPDVLLRAHISELDMDQLTSALGWPSFSGKISGEIPGVSLDDGILGVDGEIRVDVFGGRIALQNLSMERPFGVLPSLAADLRVSDLDLEQLTQTFSFGRIAGRLDGYVNDLRMLDWKPVAFDAWLGTPERQEGSKDISRQAVNRLTTIGGGPATTALTGPLMRMFSSFSYRRLGLGCRLQNNVCHLRGLSEDEASVLILEGAGVPKITIRAFNRNMDWPQMVSNLLAISSENPVQVGGQPDS